MTRAKHFQAEVDARVLRPLAFPLEKRRKHPAHQLAPGNPDKQSLLRSLPLFDVALRGGLALRGR